MKSKVQGSEVPSQNHAVRVKLPKISLQKFSGKVEHWQEFWNLSRVLYMILLGWLKLINSNIYNRIWTCQ